MNKFLRLSFLIFLISSFFCTRLIAQAVITNYGFTKSQSGGAFVGIAGTNPTLTGNVDDGYFNGIPIGFDFWYMGVKYTTVSASTNGWFTFGANITNAVKDNDLAGAGSPRPVIAPLWEDLSIIAATNFTYSTSGSSGSRVLTLQWNNIKFDYNAAAAGISFQAKIYEATGVVQFIYEQDAGALNSPNASIGITATATDSGSFLSLNNATNTATVSSTVSTNSISAKPVTGQTFTFTPTPLNTPNTVSFTNVSASGLTVNWGNVASETGYVVYRSTDNLNYTYVDRTASNVTSLVQTGLLAGITYYYKVYTLRESLSMAAIGSQATLAGCPTVYPAGMAANYKLDGNANDETGLNNGTFQNAPTATINRFGTATSAYNFNGTSQYMSTSQLQRSPYNFTLSVWFKTNTVTGGKLVSFGSEQTGSSGAHDRHIFMSPDGRIHFGVYPGVVRVISTATALNDNTWHQAVASLGPSGMKLYVDGAMVGTNASVTSAEQYDGYWRIGYDRIDNSWTGWSGGDKQAYFSGTIDDVLIYNTALTDAEATSLYNNPSVWASNNGPVCAGATITLKAATIAGATYSWSGPSGFTSNVQNPTPTAFYDVNAGTYTVQITKGSCVTNASTIVTKNTLDPGLWAGKVSTDWSNANNWCTCELPTNAVDVLVPTNGPTNNPLLTTAGYAKNITIETSRSLTISGSGDLQIRGAIINNGTLTATAGKITLNGTTAQVIPANAFATNTIKDLTTSNNAGVTLGGALRLTGTLTPTLGAFNSDGFLTLASTASNTAQVAIIPVVASVQGNVTVERYIKGGAQTFRTYRMLSSPVYDAPTTFQTSGTRTYNLNQFKDDFFVTGVGGTANGFDASPNNNTTAFTYATTGYVAATNITNIINAGKGVHIFYRGDKINNASGKIQANNPSYPTPEGIAMTFKGILNQQSVVVTLDYATATNGKVGFNLVGNPYAATIDWNGAGWTKTNIGPNTWIWNPNIRQYAVWNGTTGTNSATKYISSGQSFFVKTTGTNPSLTFTEDTKAITQQFTSDNLLMSAPVAQKSFGKRMSVQEIAQVSPPVIRVKMNKVDAFNEDEAVIVMKNNSSAKFTDEDAVDFDGESVFLSSLSSDNSLLAINYLPPVDSVKSVKLSANATASGNYSLTFNVNDLPNNYQLLLKDSLNNTIVPITPGMVQPFSVDRSNALSFAPGRFQIMMEPAQTLPVKLLSFEGKVLNGNAVKLSWKTVNETNHSHYYIEKSVDQTSFANAIKFTSVTNVANGSYQLIDNSPLNGYNYYRLAQVDNNGATTYYGPYDVKFGLIANTNNALSIFPNPVNDWFNISYAGVLSSENYQLTIANISGQKLETLKLSKSELINGFKVNANKYSAGVYVVEVKEKATGKAIGISKLMKQ
jgi:hypothetical protein